MIIFRYEQTHPSSTDPPLQAVRSSMAHSYFEGADLLSPLQVAAMVEAPQKCTRAGQTAA